MMKRFLLLVGCVVLMLPFTSSAFSGQGGCGSDCLSCHKLEKSEAEAVVRKLAPNAQVKDIKLSPVKSLWLIEVEADGKQGGVYLDFSKKYLIGQIIPVDAVGKPAPQRTADFSRIPLKDGVLMGAKNAKKKIAVFSDPDCPYCRKLHDEMKAVLAKRKDIAFYLMLHPLPMHKEAYKKAQAIVCEKGEKAVSLADAAFAGKAVPEPTCGTAKLEKLIALAKELEFNGTPTLVRDDGLVLGGFLPADKLIEWIDSK